MIQDSRPIYVKIAEVLYDRRRAGESPLSVRKVASQFGVSSVTASRALQLLKIQNGNGNGGAHGAATAERWAVCLHVSPGPHQHAAAQLTADGFRALAQEGHATFDHDSLRLGSDTSAANIRNQLRAAHEGGARGLFLLPSRVNDEAMQIDEALVQACSELRLPVVLIERNLRGEDRPIEHDLVCFHDFEGGRLLTRHLIEQRCRRIAFLTGSPTSSHVERLAGYYSALHSAGIEDSLVLPRKPTAAAGAAYTDHVTQLMEWEADGVICYHEYAAVGMIIELLRRGKTVPGDIAVADFYSLGLGESFSIGITSYAFPAKTVAARALDTMRWRMKTPDAPPVKLVVPGNLIIRNSTVGEAVAAAR